MKVLFIADDGTQFNDRNDCEKYEKRNVARDEEVFLNELFMYDNSGKRVYIPVLATYADIRTNDAVGVFFALADNDGTSTAGIEKPGKYIFGIGGNTWTSYEVLKKCFEKVTEVFMLGNKPVSVTIDLGGCGVKLEADRNSTVKEVIDRAGILMDGLKCNILMGKRGFLLTENTMKKSFNELGVKDGCTLRLREEKEWE